MLLVEVDDVLLPAAVAPEFMSDVEEVLEFIEPEAAPVALVEVALPAVVDAPVVSVLTVDVDEP